MSLDVQVRPRGAGKKNSQQREFSEGVTRMVRSAAKEKGCGVTVTQAAGWTTATADPEVEAGRIRFVRY